MTLNKETKPNQRLLDLNQSKLNRTNYKIKKKSKLLHSCYIIGIVSIIFPKGISNLNKSKNYFFSDVIVWYAYKYKVDMDSENKEKEFLKH